MTLPHSFQHINCDMARIFAYDSNAKDDAGQKQWARVSTKLLSTGKEKKQCGPMKNNLSAMESLLNGTIGALLQGI